MPEQDHDTARATYYGLPDLIENKMKILQEPDSATRNQLRSVS